MQTMGITPPGEMTGTITSQTSNTLVERWSFCPRCGLPLDRLWNYCASCGTKVEILSSPWTYVRTPVSPGMTYISTIVEEQQCLMEQFCKDHPGQPANLYCPCPKCSARC